MGNRVVLTTIGSLGDLHPYMALALELRKRGYEVVIATSELYRFKVQAEGIEFYPVRPNLSFNKETVRRAMDPNEGAKYIHFELVLPHLRDSYEDLMNAVEGADLLITHPLILAAPLVAAKTGIHWVSTILAPVLITSAYDSLFLSNPSNQVDSQIINPLINGVLIWLGKLIFHSWNDPVRQFRAELGLQAGEDPLFEGKYSPELVLALFSGVFAKRQPDWSKQIHITGFTFYDCQGGTCLCPELAQFLDAGSPPIVFTLGSAAVHDAGDFYIESAIAAKQLGHRAVLLMGENKHNFPQNLLSENIAAFDYAPYSLIFPRSIAIVNQGGFGTTAQALRASRPMLIMPYSHDQPNNAARAERLGVARTIKRSEYTAEQAAAELNQLLSEPSYTKRSAEVGRQIQLENGVQVACDAIEAHLKLPNPIQRNQGSRTAGLFG